MIHYFFKCYLLNFFFFYIRKQNDQSPLTNEQNPTNNKENSRLQNTSDSSTSHNRTPVRPAFDSPQSIETDSECLPKYKRDLVAKQKILRTELSALQPQTGHMRLEVSRSEIFEVCYYLYDLINYFFMINVKNNFF